MKLVLISIIIYKKRKIHRTSLSNLLKELMEMKILKQKNKQYKLTKKGIEIRKKIIDITNELLKPNICTEINIG